jgi:hypothetical protein
MIELDSVHTQTGNQEMSSYFGNIDYKSSFETGQVTDSKIHLLIH